MSFKGLGLFNSAILWLWACIPLFLAFFGHAFFHIWSYFDWAVYSHVSVGLLNVAHVCRLTDKLYRVVAALPLDPISSGPLTDAPAGLVLWAALFPIILVSVITHRAAPRFLTSVLPETCAL